MQALRELILEFDPDIAEAWKYRMPVFVLRGRMFCYLWKDKKTGEPYIGIVEGNRIDHPKLVAGNRARMKILPVDPNSDLPVDEIRAILDAARKLYPTS